ncbi:CFI-box-CTERM domain-containing protein [Lysobacter korlensis]|uniref:CFI-box-CTERM domain-containing protein n=1 Tax=Lysobacter korlensis TaxID=553636 RepID=A0ABV6S1T2_9GAMM
MFPPEIQRCIAELQPLQAKLLEAESSSQASVAQIYEWERQCIAIGGEMRVLSRKYGFPDVELGEAAGDAALRMSVLMALLRRAPEGHVSRAQLLDRIEQLKDLYETCETYAPRANSFNQQMTIDYTERLGQLAVFEQHIDKFMKRATNPFAQGGRPSTSGGCYIATAVYGSYDSPPVMTLRRYRDETLERSAFGRVFIRSYYLISPPLARHFAIGSPLSRAARLLLDVIVYRLEARRSGT